jgi:hypothetical protein
VDGAGAHSNLLRSYLVRRMGTVAKAQAA